jgi:hypothetical protein
VNCGGAHAAVSSLGLGWVFPRPTSTTSARWRGPSPFADSGIGAFTVPEPYPSDDLPLPAFIRTAGCPCGPAHSGRESDAIDG